MRQFLPKLAFALTIIASMTFVPKARAQQTLSGLVDRSRVLLIFAPNGLDGRYGKQLSAFEHHEADLRSRDVVVIPVLMDPGPPTASSTLRVLQPPLIQADEQITIRRRFHIQQNEFAVILLGKDGGEKLRSLTPVTLLRLDRTIDAMPGRKDEMKNQH
jgi:hypothetical protein